MVFKDGGIKAKKALQGRTGTHNNKSACDDDCRPAGDIRQRKVYGSSPVAAKKDGRMPGHARPPSGSCQDACKQSPVGVKRVKASCVGKIVKSSSGSSKFMKFSSESCKHGATPSSSSSSGGSRDSADLNSRSRRRLSTEGGSESSRKQVCPYSYCSLNVRDRATQLSFKRSLGSRRGSASSAAGDINSSPRRDLSTEGNPEHTRKKRCPYTYCSLNDRDRVTPLSFKRSRASRRSLMKKGLNVTLDNSEAAGNQSREQSLSPPMPNCHVDYMTEENTLMPEDDPCNGCLDCPDDSVNLSAESGKDRGLGCAVSACKSTECDHGALEFNGKPPLEGIKISESLLDGSGCESSADDLLKQLEEYKGGTLSTDIDVSACDITKINCDSYPQSEDSDPHCFVQMDASGILCGGHTEPDRPVDESLLESAASIKGEVKEESGSDAGNLTDEPVSEIGAIHCLEQFVGCEDDANGGQGNDVYDYGCTMDNEPLCLVHADTLGKQCIILANSDRPPGGSVNDNGTSCKQEVKDELIKIAESLLNGSDSEFCVDDSRQFAECYEDGQDGNYRSDSDVSTHESIEINDYDYDYGVKDEHIKIAEDLLNGSNSEFGVDDSRPFAEGNEDGDDHHCRSASDISAHELIESNDYDYGHGKDSALCCSVQLGAPGIQCSSHEESNRPLDGSPFDLCASPLSEVKEENINIAVPDSSVNRSPFELSASPNSKKDGKDEEYTNVEESIVDHLVSEICANDSIKQLSEFDDGQSDCLRTDTDIFAHESKEYNGYDCDHHMDAKPWPSIQVDNFEMHCSNQTEPDSTLDGWPLEFPVSSESEVEEDYYKIIAESGLNGPVAEFSPCSRNQVKEYGNIAEENGNDNQQVKFRRGRCGHRFSEPISEPEKVNLRHQLIPERKAAEEWMIDYALIKIVNELSPLRKSKVEMLVEAFQSVMPLSECETNDLEHGRTNFNHIWPMQACN